MEETVLPYEPPKPLPPLPLCEYRNCSKKATKTLKFKDGKIMGYYCDEHYFKTIKQLKEWSDYRWMI